MLILIRAARLVLWLALLPAGAIFSVAVIDLAMTGDFYIFNSRNHDWGMLIGAVVVIAILFWIDHSVRAAELRLRGRPPVEPHGFDIIGKTPDDTPR